MQYRTLGRLNTKVSALGFGTMRLPTVGGVDVEKVYPLHSPAILKVKILSVPKKIRRSKLYFLRDLSRKKSRRKIGASA